MKLNQIHLHAINKVFCVVHYVGLSLWNVTFMGPAKACHQNVIFSKCSLTFSMIIVFLVLSAIISQHSKKLAGFETLFNSSISTIVRFIRRMVQYSYIVVIYVPVWILRKKMKVIYEKLLLVKSIVNFLNSEISERIVSFRIAVRILFCILVAIIHSVMGNLFAIRVAASHSSSNNGKTVGFAWDTVLAYMVPAILQSLCIIHFITLMSLVSTRMEQVQELLDRVT